MRSLTILLIGCGFLISCGQNQPTETQSAVKTKGTRTQPEETATKTSIESVPYQSMDITDQIQAMGQEVTQAYEQGDAEALANFFTEDAQAFQPNSGIVEGKENIRDFWQALLDVGVARYQMNIRSATHMGQVGHAVGSSRLYLEDDTLLDEAKFVLILKKVNGQWKIQTDIWNSNMPCPVEAP